MRLWSTTREIIPCLTIMTLKTKTHDIERVSTVQRASQPAARTASEHERVAHHDVLQRALMSQSLALRPKDILTLQRTVGNRAVQQILQRGRRSTIQAKLAVGPANDHYEREADRVAASVMSESAKPTIQRQASEEEDNTIKTKPIAFSIPPFIQRQEADEDEDESPIQTKPLATIQRQETPDEEDENPVQLRSDAHSDRSHSSVEPGVEYGIDRARGGGQPLPAALLKRMEGSFGADFSAVRVHADSESDSLNRSLHARAFTTGHDLFFRRGEYNPDNRRGQELIAHELTHVVQQNGGASGKKNLSLQRSTSRVIQRGVWDYLKRLVGYADEKRGEFKVDVTGEYGNRENKPGEQYRRPNYNEELAADIGNYTLMGISGGSAAYKAVVDRGKIAISGGNIFSDATPLPSDLGQHLSSAGAVGAGIGILPAAIDVYKGKKAYRDKANTDQQQRLALGLGASGLGNVAQQTAQTIFHTANRYGDTAVASGAQYAAGGAAVATGAVDIVRGWYAKKWAEENIKKLQELRENQSHALIPKAARQAQSTQRIRRESAKYTMGKGALTFIGGGLLLASAVGTGPIGWLLLGAGALVGLLGVYKRYKNKEKRREAIVAEVLGVSKDYQKWKKRLAELKGPWYSRNMEYRHLIPSHGPSPIELKLKERGEGFISIEHFYTNYVSKTADDLYDLGVSSRNDLENQAIVKISKWDQPQTQSKADAIESVKSLSFKQIHSLYKCGDLKDHVYGNVEKLLDGMGLRAQFEKAPPEPTEAKIGKALHE